MRKHAATATIAAIVAFFVVFFMGKMGPHPENAPIKQETAFERVMRTNTLRCGYMLLPPQLIRDPNTKQFSGVAYDLINEAAKILGLKVEWTEEVNFSTVAEGLKSERYDSLCLTAYRWGPSARVMEYTNPIFYSTTNVYVRANDTRFDNDLNLINDENVTIATIDGEAAQFIKESDFPKGKHIPCLKTLIFRC